MRRPPPAVRWRLLGVVLARFHLLAGCALVAGVPALAQETSSPAPVSAESPAQPEAGEQVQFSAATLDYDYEADIVTATGEVRMTRGGERLRADKVVWDRRSGRVTATGDIAVTNPDGDVAYGDSIELTDSLKDGVVKNMLVVLERGGRLAAVSGRRHENGTVDLDRAVFSGCAVTGADGCPKEPTWKITAVKVFYRPDRQRVYYRGARFHLLGITSPPLPRFSNSISGHNESGLLTPSARLDRINGVEITVPLNIALAPNRSLQVIPHVFTAEMPMLEARYRALTSLGAFSIAGYATSSRRSEDLATGVVSGGTRAFRGYLDASGRFQLDPNWSVSGSLRLVTDRTFLRRYDISWEDRLRTTASIQRVDADSYFSIAGWMTQTMRVGEIQGQQPVALPEIDYRRRVRDLPGGSTLQLQLNSLALTRSAGQDTQRAFASARWDLRRITNWGQELTLTAFGRGDLYNSHQNDRTSIATYRGMDGFQGRVIGALAADLRWPFIGAFLGGTQRLTPRLQFVASPRIANLRIPNEDARAVDLEDSNLFALNRFSGYDRWEDSTRVTYGADWALDLPGISITTNIGQSYRVTQRPSILPDGTGLSDRFSDVVGRTNVRFHDLVTLTHRYRLDKDDLAVRRNEFDATVGSRETYGQISYLRLNRDISAIEDLQDREEIRLAARVKFARFWSAFGSTVIDLTDRNEDVLSLSDGFDPLRHRVGVAYEDDCLELGFAWKRDYAGTGDARRGNSYLLTLAFKGIGR